MILVLLLIAASAAGAVASGSAPAPEGFPWNTVITVISVLAANLVAALLAWGGMKTQFARLEASVNTIKEAQKTMPTNDSMKLAIIEMRDETNKQFLVELDKRVPLPQRRSTDQDRDLPSEADDTHRRPRR